ncbi:MAG: DUF4446 family protein [Actinomycetota bacterium]|jgi:hypothetical protein
MAFPPEVLTIVALAGLVVSGLAVYLLVTNTPKGGRKLSENRQAVVLLGQHGQDIARLKVAVRQLSEEQRQNAALVVGAVQRVGLVRYDAYDEMGGHLSFSAALLDAGGDGIVITSINGRQDTRCYAKPVEGWTSRHNLSTEEEQAIQQALAAQPAATPPVSLAAQGRGRPARRGA